MEIFNNISADEFFKNYWQKKPLLIKNAVKDIESPMDADELAGLACEPEIESRLVLETGGEKPWEVIAGPLSEKTLTSLPESNWSLSVQGVDRLVPEVSNLLSYFKFLPNWLLDDILVSYAPDKGSVGAHIDNYDVFIIQAQGRRRWLLGGKPEYNEEYEEGLDIRLLKSFEPEHEWELSTGDLLYIPTRFAHHGIAVGECLNYSVGYRAPTDGELLRSLSNWAMEKDLSEKFFRERNPAVQESPGEVTEKSLAAIAEHMKTLIDTPDFKLWFGEYISEPKTFYAPFEPELHLSSEELAKRLEGGEVLESAESLKRCWIDSEQPALFMEGERIEVPEACGSEVLALLCDLDQISFENISNSKNSSESLLELLTMVYNKGYFAFEQ